MSEASALLKVATALDDIILGAGPTITISTDELVESGSAQGGLMTSKDWADEKARDLPCNFQRSTLGCLRAPCKCAQFLRSVAVEFLAAGREKGVADVGASLIKVADTLARDPKIDGRVSAVLREIAQPLLARSLPSAKKEGK